MSIILAYKKDDAIYMATDTRVIVNGCKRNDILECDYKIQKLDNGMLVGITGEMIERQTIFAYPDTFTLDKKGELTHKHIVKEIIPKLFEVLKKEELLIVPEDENPYMKANILLAYKDTMFSICSDFCVLKTDTFQNLGKVSNYAIMQLLNSNKENDANERLVKALDCVAKNSYLVGAPYLLIDTKEQNYKLVRGSEYGNC